jgi:predicted small secreted protein
MSKFFLTLLGADLLVGLNACNTVSGVGQDVSAVGRDVSAGARGVESAIRND